MKKRRIKKTLGHKPLPQRALLHQLFEYNFDTGELYWKKNMTVAGYITKNGYRKVAVNKSAFYVHRLIYLMFHGEDPGKFVVDHIDGIKSNNCLVNLRMVKQKINQKNTAAARAKGIVPKPEKRSLFFD